MRKIFAHFPDSTSRVIFVLALLTIGQFVFFQMQGLENAYGWIITTFTELEKISADNFSLGLFQYAIPAENQLIYKTFSLAPYEFDVRMFHLMLLSLGVGLAIICSAASYFPRWWFFGVNVGIILLINQIHLEELLLFGTTDRTVVFVFVGILLVLGYYFQAFAEETPLHWRVLSFLLLFSVLGFIIGQYAQTPTPFIYMAPYAYYAAAILAIIFIALVAQEVIFFILWGINQTGSGLGGNHARHFLILGGVYVVNLLFLYLKNEGFISWEVALLDEYFILLLSSLIAFWTIHFKEPIFISFDYKTSIFPLLGGLAIVTYGLLGSQSAMVNDPVLDSFENIISYIHLAFGVMFLFYIVLNFINPLSESLPVYRIAYKEVNFPYITSILGSVVGVAAFFFLADKEPMFELKGGYYNMQGDVQYSLGNAALAETYYEQGSVYGGSNHKSNMQLAAISKQRNNKADQQFYLKRALIKNPSPQAYVELSDYYKGDGDYFNALFSLQTGLQKFPKNTYLRNNLGLLYTSANILDSALIYLSDQYFSSKWENMSIVNNWYVYTKSNFTYPPDSILEVIENEKSLELLGNYLAYANKNSLDYGQIDFAIPKDTLIKSSELAYFNNLSINAQYVNHELPEHLVKLASVTENSDYKTILDYDAFLASYKQGDYHQALRLLDILQGATPRQRGYYLNIAGMLSMKLGAFQMAEEFFYQSLETREQAAALNYGISLCEQGAIEEAIEYWEYVLQNDPDSLKTKTAFNLIYNLKLTHEEVLAHSNDVVKYQYLKYNGLNMDATMFRNILQTITDQSAQAQLLLEMAKKRIEYDQLEIAHDYWILYNDFGFDRNAPIAREIQLTFALSSMESISESTENIFLNPNKELLQKWPIAMVFNKPADTTGFDRRLLDLATADPFNETSVIAVARYFNEQGKDQEAYDLLQSAREVNKYSIPLIKAYALGALRVHLTGYAEDALLQLYSLVDPVEYSTFEVRFQDLNNELESQDAWDF